MNSLLKFLIFLHLVGFSISAKGQYEINSSVWIDEYTVQHHIDQYLSNLLFSFEYYQKWNGDLQQFESALPARLNYSPFATKEINVKAKVLDYYDRYLLLKWEHFSPERIDSLWKHSKKLYSNNINYDDQGRITSSAFKNYKHLPSGERIDYRIVYEDADTVNKMFAEVIWHKGIDLQKKSSSEVEYTFSQSKRLLHTKVSHESPSGPINYENNYRYDSLGRLVNFTQIPSSEVYINRTYAYHSTPFNLDSAKNEYQMLKTPSLQHWLRSYPDSGLTIIAYQKFERNRNSMVEYSYLVDSEQNRLFMLRPYPHYFGVNYTDSSVTKSYCGISRNQDLNDTIPYDPNYEPRYIGTTYSQCSIEEHYTTPPGLVNTGGSGEGYRRSEHALSNGWKRVTYQHGTDGPYRFAPGYPVSVRYDLPNDKHLILDPKGVVRYIIDYDRIIKIEEDETIK